MTSAERVVVQLDVYPANVALPTSTTYNNVRAVIADGRLQVFCLTGAGVKILYDSPSFAVDGQVSSGVGVTTEDGVVWVEQSGGCGCGDQLKISDLYPGRLRVMIPLHS